MVFSPSWRADRVAVRDVSRPERERTWLRTVQLISAFLDLTTFLVPSVR
jgi:hypothetical protein